MAQAVSGDAKSGGCMRTGFKVVSAGLALVIGCSTVAISPLDLPILCLLYTSERSKCRLEWLSPGEARAAYDLLVLGDPLEVGDHLDAVFMSIKGGRGVFECSTEGEMIPTAVYTLTPKWRAFLSRHVGDLRDLAEHAVTSS